MPEMEPVEIPCGELIANPSPEEVGIKNYTVKRDWRRIATGRDARREGFVPFQPNTSHPTTPANLDTHSSSIAAIAATPLPASHLVVSLDPTVPKLYIGQVVAISGLTGAEFSPANGTWIVQSVSDTTLGTSYDLGTQSVCTPNFIAFNVGTLTWNPPITKICQVRAGNGRVAVIAASGDSIYRYFSLEVGDYFAGDGTADSYFVEAGPNTPYFQESFNDWVQIGSGFSTLSTYWEAVQVNNILVLNNGIDLPVTFNVQDQSVVPIYELRDQGIASVGTIWELNGILMCGNIVEIDDSVVAGQTLSPLVTLMQSAEAYARFSADDPSGSGQTADYITASTNRFQLRVIWADPAGPNRFAASIPCSTTLGSQHIKLLWPSKSFSNGQQILVLGAGVNGGNATATILWINPTDGTDVFIDTVMLETLTITSVQALDSVGSIVGFQDLTDDGSAIIRGEKIRTSAAIYKDTSIFICNFTGTTGSPFTFQIVYRGANSIYYRNTLVSIVDDWKSWHFFAGRNCIYKFDLVNLTPTPINKDIDNLFFGNAAALMVSPQLVFASDNPITNEIFLSVPGALDSLICFDYKYDSISTSSMQISCGALVQMPTSNIVEQGVDVFLMGDLNNLGAVIQYGRKDDGTPPVFSRCTGIVQGTGYAAIFQSGVSALAGRINDTYVNSYELRVKKLTGRVTMELIGGGNPDQTNSLWSRDTTAANGATPILFVPCGNVAQTVGDRITVTDPDVQCEVVSRTIVWTSLPSMGAGRS